MLIIVDVIFFDVSQTHQNHHVADLLLLGKTKYGRERLNMAYQNCEKNGKNTFIKPKGEERRRERVEKEVMNRVILAILGEN